MKTMLGPLFRALVAIVVGALLIKFRQETLTWLTIVIGCMFLVSGLVSCLSYYRERKRIQQLASTFDTNSGGKRPRLPFFPIVGLGSVILGGILATMPNTFINGVAYVLAGILLLGALNQVVSLGNARRYSKVPVFYWILPLVTLVVALLIIIKPLDALSSPLLIIGWCMVFYGVVEVLNVLKIHQVRRAYERAEEAKIVNGVRMDDNIEDAEIISETPNDTTK